MKKTSLFMFVLLFCSSAYSGIIECVATNKESGEVVSDFFIDYVSGGFSIIKFEKPITYQAEALEFQLVYSRLVGAENLYVGVSTQAAQNQLVEFFFDGPFTNFRQGVLRAGDQMTMGRMGKFQSYNVSCN